MSQTQSSAPCSSCRTRTNCGASRCPAGNRTLPGTVLCYGPRPVHSQCGDGAEGLSVSTSPARSTRVSPYAVSVEYWPLKERLLECPDDLIEMVSQITDVLHALCYEAKIVHGSVSYSNIVWNPGPDGRARFFLVDFDCSVATDARRPATERPHRCFIDTLAFMSVGLLKAGPGSHGALDHQLYHDYESLFWVSLWAAMKTETVLDPLLNGKIRKAVREWETGEPATIAAKKGEIIRLETLDKVPLTPRFEKLYPFLWDFAFIFVDAMYQANRIRPNKEAPEDREALRRNVLAGAITRGSIKAIVKEYYNVYGEDP